jgi:hypothetical protein
LMIWISKSLQRFLGLSIKTKQVTVYRLHHKTDGRMRRCGAHEKASQIWVFQSDLKIGGGATVGGARGTIMVVT